MEWNGSDLWQVKGPWGEQCVVNWPQRSCTCRKWEVSGIPCKHVVACIHDMADSGMNIGLPEDYVHESYKLKTWKDVYSFQVNPVNGRQFWAKFDCPTTLVPPKAAPQVGRPSKARKKSVGEIEMVKGGKLTRSGKTVKCGICKGSGHNKRSCTAQGVASHAGTSHTGPSGSQAQGGSHTGPSGTKKRPRKVTDGSASGSQMGSHAPNGSQSQAGSQVPIPQNAPVNVAAPGHVAAGFVTPTKRTKKTASRLSPL